MAFTSVLMKTFTPTSWSDLAVFLRAQNPSFFFSSQTSTVIPFDRLSKIFDPDSVHLVNLSQIPGEMEMRGKNLVCRGAVNWQAAREFCQEHGREIMTAPTEELACVPAGVATSCTGERCFGYGTLRQQIVSLKMMDSEGKIQDLGVHRKLSENALFQGNEAAQLLQDYQQAYQQYQNFKNAPFPRLERETDLMTGLEGQLGIVLEVELHTVVQENLQYLFFVLPRWEEDYGPHLKILEMVQPLRHLIHCCEFMDSNSMDLLDPSLRPGPAKKDFIFLEVGEKDFEAVYEMLVAGLEHFEGLGPEHIYEMGASKFHQLRVGVPRGVSERNSRAGATKKGTDIQVRVAQMGELLEHCRNLAQQGIDYCLFAHFGDAHLHFNFMPTREQQERCDEFFEALYLEVRKMRASPFAEHGIGIIKQKFIAPFLQGVHRQMFRYLKSQMDPHNLFFPGGYLQL